MPMLYWGHSMFMLTPYNIMHCTYIIIVPLVLHVSSTAIKIPVETTPHNRHLIYLYTETWWQCWTCSSHGKKNKTGQWEREEEQPRYSFMFKAESLHPRVRPTISGFSCRTLVHINAQESQGSGRGLWIQRNQTILFSGSMF